MVVREKEVMGTDQADPPLHRESQARSLSVADKEALRVALHEIPYCKSEEWIEASVSF